jgi:hypothetical protein
MPRIDSSTMLSSSYLRIKDIMEMTSLESFKDMEALKGRVIYEIMTLMGRYKINSYCLDMGG